MPEDSNRPLMLADSDADSHVGGVDGMEIDIKVGSVAVVVGHDGLYQQEL